jgi:hypothetical protein
MYYFQIFDLDMTENRDIENITYSYRIYVQRPKRNDISNPLILAQKWRPDIVRFILPDGIHGEGAADVS